MQVEDDRPRCVYVPDWDVPANVRAVMSVRTGGVSPAPWESLNLGALSGDSPAHVAENRRRFARAAGMPQVPRFLLQVHGADLVEWEGGKAEAARKNIHADAQITARSALPLAVLAADCLPVLFTDAQGEWVAAAHAGWRGVLAGVLVRTVQEMRARLPAGRGVRAWIGPGIGPTKFEVGPEVAAQFKQRNPAWNRYFAASIQKGLAGRPERRLADLAGIAQYQLEAMNVLVTCDQQCTVSSPACFFSYRRDGVTGRLAAAIWRQ